MKKTTNFKRLLSGFLCFCMVSQNVFSNMTITSYASNAQNIETGAVTSENDAREAT